MFKRRRGLIPNPLDRARLFFQHSVQYIVDVIDRDVRLMFFIAIGNQYLTEDVNEVRKVSRESMYTL